MHNDGLRAPVLQRLLAAALLGADQRGQGVQHQVCAACPCDPACAMCTCKPACAACPCDPACAACPCDPACAACPCDPVPLFFTPLPRSLAVAVTLTTGAWGTIFRTAMAEPGAHTFQPPTPSRAPRRSGAWHT
eukprot:350951-Chlamydomonas_euryale.AAC.1